MGLDFSFDPFILPDSQAVGWEGWEPEGPRLTPRRALPDMPWGGAMPAPGMSAPAMQFMQSIQNQPGGLMGSPESYSTPMGLPMSYGRAPHVNRVAQQYDYMRQDPQYGDIFGAAPAAQPVNDELLRLLEEFAAGDTSDNGWRFNEA